MSLMTWMTCFCDGLQTGGCYLFMICYSASWSAIMIIMDAKLIEPALTPISLLFYAHGIVYQLNNFWPHVHRGHLSSV